MEYLGQHRCRTPSDYSLGGMRPIKTISRWLPLVLLAAASVFSWRTAQATDADDAAAMPLLYDQQLTTPVLSARRIPRTLQAPIAEDAVEPAVEEIATRGTPTSCFVVTLNGQPVNNENGSLPLIPASNEKLLTTWAGIAILDEDRTFTTDVRITNTPVDGVMDGDLYLVGGGDPFLVTANWPTQFSSQDGRAFTLLETLADKVAGTGIVEITGTIFGDESYFDSVRFGPWDQRLIDQQQSGPLSALSVNQGFSSWPEEYPNLPQTREMAADPAVNAAAVFARLLSERGIAVGPSTSGTAPDTAVEIAKIESATVVEIATHINSYSDNYAAEILTKHLGREVSGIGSTEAGAAAIRDALATNGTMPITGVVINDGSGLAESNRVSCDLLVAVLSTATPESTFAKTLSIAGERGSLLNRFSTDEVDGQVFGKTGSLNTVTALSGFVLSDSDEDSYAIFSIIINGELARTYDGLQEEVVNVLADFPDAPDVEQLDPTEPIDS